MSANPVPLSEEQLETCLQELEGGDSRRLARVLTWIENGDARGDQLLSTLWSRRARGQFDSSHAVRIGITGAPGVGKSSVISELLPRLQQQGERVAVLAVDPTSPVSGGALLGDRARMDPQLGNAFVRSLATRGGRGGVARCTDDAALALEYAQFGVILIETVGVGQLELEIVDEADHVVLLVSPESGDTLQFLKGGMMEVVDELLINKGDRPGADAMQSLAEELARDRGIPQPCRVSATGGTGLDSWVSLLHERVTELRQRASARPRQRLARSLVRRAEELWLAECWSRLGGRERLRQWSDQVYEGSRTLLDVVGSLRIDALEERNPTTEEGKP